MKIIISPAKQIVESDLYLKNTSDLIFKKDTQVLLDNIKKLSIKDLKEVFKANDKITNINYDRFKSMDLNKAVSPAIFSYDGLQYKYLSAHTLEEKDLDYLEENLLILSGFYGIVRPSTKISAYRLEMQAEFKIVNKNLSYNNLYDFWADKLIKYIKNTLKDDIIINLASKEYSKCISKFSEKEKIKVININFYEEKNGKLKQTATLAKMARGEFVREMAIKKVKKVESLKSIKLLNFEYDEKSSNEDTYNYLKK